MMRCLTRTTRTTPGNFSTCSSSLRARTIPPNSVSASLCRSSRALAVQHIAAVNSGRSVCEVVAELVSMNRGAFNRRADLASTVFYGVFAAAMKELCGARGALAAGQAKVDEARRAVQQWTAPCAFSPAAPSAPEPHRAWPLPPTGRLRVVALEHRPGLVPGQLHGTRSGMPRRTRLRTPVRRWSCGMWPGPPAATHGFFHLLSRRVIGCGLLSPTPQSATSRKNTHGSTDAALFPVFVALVRCLEDGAQFGGHREHGARHRSWWCPRRGASAPAAKSTCRHSSGRISLTTAAALTPPLIGIQLSTSDNQGIPLGVPATANQCAVPALRGGQRGGPRILLGFHHLRLVVAVPRMRACVGTAEGRLVNDIVPSEG
jgi:hypothetical protein